MLKCSKFVLLLTSFVCVKVLPSNALENHETTDASLVKMVKEMAARLQRQDDVIARLQNTIVGHDDKISRLRNRVVGQGYVIAGLQNRGLDQEKKMAKQQKVVSRLQKRVLHQDNTIRQQSDNIRLLKEKADMKVKARSHPHHSMKKRSDDDSPLDAVIAGVSQGLTDVRAKVQALEAKDVVLTNYVNKATGSVFVRWGSSTCANSSDFVYSGMIGGSWFNAAGASNALCLPHDPQFAGDTWANMDAMFYGDIYGSEYEMGSTTDPNDLSGVCAVCRVPRATNVMIPARTTCSPGWTTEYTGFVMGDSDKFGDHHSGTDFICIDGKFEGREGSKAHNDNGHLLYLIKTRCGSLPCPPYAEGKILTCVVCSK